MCAELMSFVDFLPLKHILLLYTNKRGSYQTAQRTLPWNKVMLELPYKMLGMWDLALLRHRRLHHKYSEESYWLTAQLPTPQHKYHSEFMILCS